MKLSLNRELGELERIVDARRRYFAEHGLPDALGFPVDLATEELFVNMIRHNRGSREPINLELEAVADGLAVRLTDCDVEPFDPAGVAPVDPTLPLAQRPVGGLGLHLVRELVGTVRYEYRDRSSTLSFLALWVPSHV
ncbi:MAG: ATP-binding protein [Parahaliea sp.]